VLGQHRSTQRRVPTGPDDEERLTADIVELARRHGRLGYRKIAEMLRSTAGWIVNDKRVERIWRREGRKVRSASARAARASLSFRAASHAQRRDRKAANQMYLSPLKGITSRADL
jgi:putative transposase